MIYQLNFSMKPQPLEKMKDRLKPADVSNTILIFSSFHISQLRAITFFGW